MPRTPAVLAMVLLSLLDLGLGAGLFLQAPWATTLWPWTTQPLDYVLLSSFLVAGWGTVLWIGLAEEWGALVGALLDVGLFNGATAGWLWVRWAGDHDPAVLVRAAGFTLSTAAEVAMLTWALRRPIRDVREGDRLLRVSFALFAVVLLATSSQLLLHRPVWPWPLEPDSSTLIGLLFLGSAVYFLYGLWRPLWHNMKGQLIAFLLYDAVLVQPYLHMGDGELGYHLNYPSLAIYWAVIVYSGALATWYLFLNPRTKGWAAVLAEGGATGTSSAPR